MQSSPFTSANPSPAAAPPRAAVLFIIFNRADVTMQVLAAIRAARPPRLYVAADGPRAQRPTEAEACTAVRAQVLAAIDWPCTVETLFREQNLGCRRAVSEAISWFFEHEESGIILEDDCLPHPSFFPYCEQLLEQYAHDTRVLHISGSNLLRGWHRDPDYSYFFSQYVGIWGWATWRRAWQFYDAATSLLPELARKNYFWNRFFHRLEQRFALQPLWATHTGQLDTWDYQWAFTLLSQSGLSITPGVNLISNIGFGDQATHTHNTDHPWANLPTRALPLPLRHPPFMMRDTLSDYRQWRSTLRDKAVARVRQLAAVFSITL
ncbi:hypothetical protein KBK19_09730 [Microvirga sp. STR05]|uniref:hypothetical protein n=1 Tax=Hymenobacter duratus TaxID=2771356 RepID=UPI001B8CAFAB|nr:hypothetical protein [Hymenobacter duratus]MBR7950222.1 hypothetical protein [Microvirga sp. STR05]